MRAEDPVDLAKVCAGPASPVLTWLCDPTGAGEGWLHQALGETVVLAFATGEQQAEQVLSLCKLFH